MKLIQKLILNQNRELLERIANDKFTMEEEKTDFINKYHKLGYTHLNMVKKNQSEIQNKKYKRVMR